MNNITVINVKFQNEVFVFHKQESVVEKLTFTHSRFRIKKRNAKSITKTKQNEEVKKIYFFNCATNKLAIFLNIQSVQG